MSIANQQQKRICKVENCGRELIKRRNARGFCMKHYRHWYRWGDPIFRVFTARNISTTAAMHGRYSHMLDRCCNANCEHYPAYGGRGITVCDRWLGKDGFKNFLADMGLPPKGTSLDRIDNDKGYSPANCHWATQTQQNINTRVNSRNKIGVKGVSYNMRRNKRSPYMAIIGVNRKSIYLGYYATLAEAVEARRLGELKYYPSVVKTADNRGKQS